MTESVKRHFAIAQLPPKTRNRPDCFEKKTRFSFFFFLSFLLLVLLCFDFVFVDKAGYDSK